MRISLDVELEDTPGQLLRALEPISKHGGNIISIVHIRDEKRPSRRLCVHLVMDVHDRETLEVILEELKSRGIGIARVGEDVRKERLTLLLIGHVVDTDLRDTIDRLNAIEGVLVSDLSLAMTHPEAESSAIVSIEVSQGTDTEKLMAAIEEIAREKKLEIVRSLEV